MSEHDHAYRNIFSHPVMVAELLRGFVTQTWIRNADFSTLERFNGEHIARHRRRRSNDMVWRLRGPEFDELQRAFTAWLRDTLLPKRAPGVDSHTTQPARGTDHDG